MRELVIINLSTAANDVNAILWGGRGGRARGKVSMAFPDSLSLSLSLEAGLSRTLLLKRNCATFIDQNIFYSLSLRTLLIIYG